MDSTRSSPWAQIPTNMDAVMKRRSRTLARSLLFLLITVLHSGCRHQLSEKALLDYEAQRYSTAASVVKKACERVPTPNGSSSVVNLRQREKARCVANLGRLQLLAALQLRHEADVRERLTYRMDEPEERQKTHKSVLAARSRAEKEVVIAIDNLVNAGREIYNPEEHPDMDYSESCARFDRALIDNELALARWLDGIIRGEDGRGAAVELLNGSLRDLQDPVQYCDELMRLLLLAQTYNYLGLITSDFKYRAQTARVLFTLEAWASKTKRIHRDRAQQLAMILGPNIDAAPESRSEQSVQAGGHPSRYELLGGPTGLRELLEEGGRRIDGPGHGYEPLFLISGRPPRDRTRVGYRRAFEDLLRRENWLEKIIEATLNPRAADQLDLRPNWVTARRWRKQLKASSYIETNPSDLEWEQWRTQLVLRTLDRKSNLRTNASEDWDQIREELIRQQKQEGTEPVMLVFALYQQTMRRQKVDRMRYAVHVIKPTKSERWAKVRVIDIGSVEDVRRDTEDFVLASMIGSRQEQTRDKSTRSYQELAELAYRRLLGKVDELEKANVLYIVPTADLERIPFAALRDDESYLIEKAEIRYLSSAVSVADYGGRRSLDSEPRYVVAVDELGVQSGKMAAAAVREALGMPKTERTTTSKKEFLEDISKQTVLYIVTHGGTSNESNIREELERTARSLSLRMVLPLFPVLTKCTQECGVLGGDDFDHMIGDMRLHAVDSERYQHDFDRILSATYLKLGNGDEVTAYDILERHEGSELVVIMACKSAMTASIDDAAIVDADKILDLRQAFFATNAETVVGSLWNVRDTSHSVELVRRYYQYLLGSTDTGKPMGRAAALRALQLELLNGTPEKEGLHPYYWAGLVSMGNWQPLSVTAR
jgi:CHAT domain-containing protein